MTTAREIIARACPWGERNPTSLAVADDVIVSLAFAGFRIVGPGEVEEDWRDMTEADRRCFPHPDGSRVEVQGYDTGYGQRFHTTMIVGSPQWRGHLPYIVHWRALAEEKRP